MAERDRLAVIPQNHAGFLEFKQYFVSNHLAAYVSAADDEARAAQPYVWQYIRVLRPHQSNHFLLGPCSHPAHVMCASTPVHRHELRDLRIVRVDFDMRRPGFGIALRDLGPVPEQARPNAQQARLSGAAPGTHDRPSN